MLSIILKQTFLGLLLTLCSHVFNPDPRTHITMALPITSKPIESTAEKLAWQAWIMMPPHEQNLEKSRKVTPKSIFVLPNRAKVPPAMGGFPADGESGSGGYAPIDCPTGTRQFESRCIPTLEINREQLLMQELQMLFQHQGGGGTNHNGQLEYDYDYDDETNTMSNNFEPPMMFQGGGMQPISMGNNYDDHLPVEDAPMKFNIFRDEFLIDGLSIAESSNKSITIFDPSASADNGTDLESERSANRSDIWSDLTTEIQTKGNGEINDVTSSSTAINILAANFTDAVTPSTTTTTTISSSAVSGIPNLSLSNMDALAVSAPKIQTHSKLQPQQQEIGTFKDDSALLITVDHEDKQRTPATEKSQKTTELMELLKVDALLPLHNASSGVTVTRSTVTPFPGPANSKHRDSAQGETVATPPLTNPLDEIKSHASQESEKDEHTRSVTLAKADDLAVSSSDEIESELPTTADTDAVTTTIGTEQLSILPSPNIVAPNRQLHEIATAAKEDPVTQVNAAVEQQKKLKVQPVIAEAIVDEQTTPSPTPPEPDAMIPAKFESANVEVTDYDWFAEEIEASKVRAKELNGEPVDDESKTTKTTAKIITTKKTVVNEATTETSKIDIAAELRIINEMVQKKRQESTTEISTPTKKATTTAAITSVTTLVTTPATISATTSVTTPVTMSVPPIQPNAKASEPKEIAATPSVAYIKTSNIFKQETAAAATFEKALSTTTVRNFVETTTTTSTLLSAKSDNNALSHKNSVESANVVADTKTELSSELNSSPTTESTSTTTESTATIWSKILPFFSYDSTTTTTTEATTTADRTMNSTENSSKNSSTFRTNRRNSKILRINNPSTNNAIESSSIIPTATTTTELPKVATTTIPPSPNTFWWIPAGWSLERSAPNPVVTPSRQVKNQVTPVASAVEQQSLLLRFWNAFPSSKT